MSANIVEVVLTAEQILGLLQSAQTLIDLLTKIQNSDPTAWAQVSADYMNAVSAWNAARNFAQG